MNSSIIRSVTTAAESTVRHPRVTLTSPSSNVVSIVNSHSHRYIFNLQRVVLNYQSTITKRVLSAGPNEDDNNRGFTQAKNLTV